MVPSRLSKLPPAKVRVDGRPLNLEVRFAANFTSRLIGLAGRVDHTDRGVGLLLTRTRSIHTVGMRFPLNLIWLDAKGVVTRVDTGVAPWRLRSCARADAVIELGSGSWVGNSIREGQRIDWQPRTVRRLTHTKVRRNDNHKEHPKWPRRSESPDPEQ